MKKKLIAALLVISMMGTLSACSGGSTSPTSSSVEEKPEAVSETVPAETEPVTTDVVEEPEYDFGGRVVRIGSYYDMTPDPESSVFSEAYSKRIAYVEENYNCKIEFVNIGGNYVDQYVTSVLAGDPIVDLGYVLSYKLLPSLIEGGIAYPVSDLGVFDFDDYKWSRTDTAAGTYKDKVYTMGMKAASMGYGIFWNKTLFEQAGLPDLYELYENGEWTWDKFKEIAIAGNQDTDKDGEIDIWGFNQRENFVWSFMTSNNAEAITKTKDGVEVNLDSEEAQEALEGYADFMINAPHLNGWLGDWQGQIFSFRDGQSMMCYEAWWISYAYLKDMSDEWGFVPFPMGPSGTEYASYNKEASPLMMLNGIEKPEEVAQIVDLIYDVYETDEEWDDSIIASFESQATDSTAVDICLETLDKVQVSPLMGFGDLNTLINEMVNEIGTGASTPQTALETYKSAIDKAVADLASYDYDAEMKEYKVEETETKAEGAETKKED